MSDCWISLAIAAFILGITIAVLVGHRRRHPSPFQPLEELEPPEPPPAPRLVTRWPPKPAWRVLPENEPVLHDAEREGWWAE